jgi:hypothetical protein
MDDGVSVISANCCAAMMCIAHQKRHAPVEAYGGVDSLMCDFAHESAHSIWRPSTTAMQ